MRQIKIARGMPLPVMTVDAFSHARGTGIGPVRQSALLPATYSVLLARVGRIDHGGAPFA
jgi:hypothetical protein